MKPHFWYSWPSWIVELISGLVLAAAVAGWDSVLQRVVVGTILSVLYEVFVDPNGWSLKDVAQRQVGLLAGAVLL
jgi:hypothetical protein